MKLELQFARDSSTTLPKTDPLFRVMVVEPNKKRRTKTPQEFGEAIKIFLGKKVDQTVLDYDSFSQSLTKLSG